MDRLEELAGRLAHGFSALYGESPEDVLATATLVAELTDELASWRQGPEPAGPLAVRDTSAGSRTALVAGAGPEDRGMARERLQELGYAVLEAESGAQALALCAQHDGAIDLLLADILMPDMSGREVAERASMLKPEMGVIYMSGYAEDEIMFYGILGPGVAALQKPVTTEALARKLAELAEAQYV
jgi:CheY-like chemotaxis protein